MLKQRTACLALAAIMTLSATSCALFRSTSRSKIPVSPESRPDRLYTAVPSIVPDTAAEPIEQNSVVLKAKLHVSENGEVFAMPEDKRHTGLCTLSLDGAQIISPKGKVLGKSDLKSGMTVEITWDGGIMETYPAQISAQKIAVISDGIDGITAYMGMIAHLYETDPGLNHGITVIALDLEKAHNLTEVEKEALTWLVGEKYGFEVITGNFDSLCESGYIDRENLRFESGILISIEVAPDDTDKDSFEFDMQKWRSGLGAIFFSDCEAEFDSGRWEFEFGGFAIA